MLLSPARLNQLLRSKGANTVVLDSTWFMPNSPRIAKAEFRAKRIPGSRFLDLDEVASPHELGLKHMMPSEKVFGRACEKFGIGPSTQVVMYDTHGVFSSPRALFMFQSFGHRNSCILDGGLPRYEVEGFPLDTTEPLEVHVQDVKYPTPTLDSQAVRSYEQIVSNSSSNPFRVPGAELVLDARGRGRYLGTDPEPRPGLSSGHIPNSLSLPFNVFLQNNVTKDGSSYTTFLPQEQLRMAVVEAIGADKADAVINGDVPVVASCGSGMTAGVIWLGLQLLGVKQISIYDESWTGYSLRPSSKIEKSL
ncbi:Rhodanese-like domain-containing protein [Mycena maculata]|uniref:Rhodanese-like domain-containing protein n=1 Tax=Mycena maculata TaxID=230809 RepID=A0AAD7P0M2_9AGAR|nr:Rhodanese-like domain-containing protein [Mycena maculata]